MALGGISASGKAVSHSLTDSSVRFVGTRNKEIKEQLQVVLEDEIRAGKNAK